MNGVFVMVAQLGKSHTIAQAALSPKNDG